MNKDEKLTITKDRLLDATFRLMEESDDPLTVTSRQIASAADVKPSMINSCFGSRENLIYSVFQKQYLGFLCSGGRHYPLDSLKMAGVDMSSPEPVEKAIDYFAGLLDQIENLMKK